MMNVANLMTLSRVFLAPIIMILMYSDNFWIRLTALVLFIIAALTDIWDGMLARKSGQVTPLGIFLDPLADKLLIISILIASVAHNEIPAWGVVIILIREFMITGLRSLGVRKGFHMMASKLAKSKTFTQMMTIIVTLIVMMLRSGVSQFPEYWETFLSKMNGQESTALYLFDLVPDIMLYIAVFFSVWSGVDYLRRNSELFSLRNGATK